MFVKIKYRMEQDNELNIQDSADLIEEISLETIKETAKKLKKLNKSWAVDLGKMISEGEGDKRFNETKVYNIVNGISSHQQFRRIFIKYAQVMIDKILPEQQVAIKTVEKLK